MSGRFLHIITVSDLKIAYLAKSIACIFLISPNDNKLKCISTVTVSRRIGENSLSIIGELLTIENFMGVSETRRSRG